LRSEEEQEVRVVKNEVHPIFDALGDDRRRLRSEEEQEVREVKTSMHPILDECPLGDGGKRLRSLPEQEGVKAFAKMYTCIHPVAYPLTWKTVICTHCTHLVAYPTT